MRRVDFKGMELISSLLKEVLSKENPKDVDSLNKCLSEVRLRYKATMGKSLFGFPNDYIIFAKRDIIKNNFIYDEVLSNLDIIYGYNPKTKLWDGSYSGCRIRYE